MLDHLGKWRGERTRLQFTFEVLSVGSAACLPHEYCGGSAVVTDDSAMEALRIPERHMLSICHSDCIRDRK